MDIELKTRKYAALVLILLIGLVLVYLLRPYYNAFILTLVLAFLAMPVYRKLSLKLGKHFSAAIMVLLTLIVIFIPIVLLSFLLANEIPTILESLNLLKEKFGTEFVIFGNTIDLGTEITKLINFVRERAVSAITEATRFFITVFLALFLLYFLLIREERYKKILNEFLPFNEKNSLRLVEEFRRITRAAIIGTGIVAVVQGALLSIGFLIFGINGALFWGFIGAILSFIPIVGTFMIWIPAGIIMILLGKYFAGIGILLWGFIVVGLADNILRPFVSKKIADIHPVITLVGVFIGVPIFGLLGVIVGPLLLSYFFLLIEMYNEEYWGK